MWAFSKTLTCLTNPGEWEWNSRAQVRVKVFELMFKVLKLDMEINCLYLKEKQDFDVITD